MPLALKREHRHSYISENLRLDFVERDMLMNVTLSRAQTIAALIPSPKMKTDVLLQSYSALLTDLHRYLPPYLTAGEATQAAGSAQEFVERYKARQTEIDEIARNAQL
jgi:hypothetical protein